MSGLINLSNGIAYVLSLQPAVLTGGNQTTTATGSQTGVTLTGSVLRCNNASDLTIHGFTAGQDGQIVYVQSVGAGNVFLAPESSTETTAANRLTNRVTSGNTPLAAGVGSAIYQYDATSARWRLLQHEQGDFISVAFSAGNFTGNGSMTWTVAAGDVTVLNYKIVGKRMQVRFTIVTTTVGGTPSTGLRIAGVTTGYTVSRGPTTWLFLDENGTSGVGRIRWDSSGPAIECRKGTDSAGVWSSSTDTTTVEGAIELHLT